MRFAAGSRLLPVRLPQGFMADLIPKDPCGLLLTQRALSSPFDLEGEEGRRGHADDGDGDRRAHRFPCSRTGHSAQRSDDGGGDSASKAPEEHRKGGGFAHIRRCGADLGCKIGRWHAKADPESEQGNECLESDQASASRGQGYSDAACRDEREAQKGVRAKLSMGAEERSCGVAAHHERERHGNERHPRLRVAHTE